jgi:hypothetical protein
MEKSKLYPSPSTYDINYSSINNRRNPLTTKSPRITLNAEIEKHQRKYSLPGVGAYAVSTKLIEKNLF